LIIDSHTHPTNLVDQAWKQSGRPFNAERLIELMDGPFVLRGKNRRIDLAIVQPPPGNTVWISGMQGGRKGIRDYMAYTRKIVSKYPDRLIGCFTFNPRFGIDAGVAEFESHVKKFNFKVLKLHSSLHGYRPDRATEWIFPVVEKAVKLRIPVLLHTGDSPFGIPSQFYPLIDHFPDATIILGHFGVQTGSSYVFEAGWIAKKNDNVLVESGWCFQPRLLEFTKLLGPDKILFASDCPPNEPGVSLRMLEVLTWDPPLGMKLGEEDLEKILGGNISKLIGRSQN
jgi:uncharacterized protein